MNAPSPTGRSLLFSGCIVLTSSLVFAQGSPSPLPRESKAKPGNGFGQTYGTDLDSYYRMSAAEFTPMQLPGSDTYSDHWYGSAGNLFSRYSTPFGGFFIGSPHIPSGALLTFLELDSCDTNAVKNVHLQLYQCDYLGDCGSFPKVHIDSSTNNTVPGCSFTNVDISALNVIVDNFLGQILLQAYTEGGDDTTSISGAIIGYKLQVSPPPDSASFNDVPTSHPFFQYIEALYSSGITGGCGAGNYCPDAPLTRGQMAVFLAKALGLQFH